MRVIKRVTGYTQDPTRYLHLDRFKDTCGDFVLIEGIFEESSQWKEYNFTEEEIEKIKKKKIIHLDFAQPTLFLLGDNPDNYEGQLYKVFSICPYTSKWLNKRQHNNKHVPIYFPFNEDYIPQTHKKRYDIIYTGHILSPTIARYVKLISKFNYRVVSNSKNPLVTNRSASYTEKLKLIAQSKITLVTNLLYIRYYQLPFIWKIPNYLENEAFKLIPKWYEIHKWFNKEILAPQLKSRVFEAAFAKSLILCRRDPFNIIERYFEPGKEFVYFEDNNLEETIQNILNNYELYEKVIERAYKRAVNNYTTKKFAENYLMKI